MIALLRNYSTLYSAYLRRQLSADINNQLAVAQQELSTGYKSDVFKDLGVRSAESLSLRATIDRDEAQVTANELVMGRMETMTDALSAMRDAVQEALELAIPNKEAALGTVDGIQQAAKAALDAVIAQANTTHAGVPLFSGVELATDSLQPWSETNAATGLSPSDVFASILAGGLPDDTAATTAIAEIEALFSDSSSTAGFNFEDTFFNGAATGAPRQSLAIGDGISVEYGVQANDTAFRQVIKGLAMLASFDPAQITDPDAYATWVGTAVDALSAGSAGLLNIETRVGAQAAQIEDANTRMTDRLDIYKNRILDLEGVDSYEAATRISLLESQLDASYAVTARLTQLSFLEYM